MLSGQKQSAWKLPAVLNLTLGGMGAGFYLMTLLINLPQSSDWGQLLLHTAVVKLLGPLLVCIGLLALTTEAGHPLKSIYLLVNLRNSWMSREALAGGLFVLFAGLDWLFPHPILRGLAAIAGLVFIIAQGMIVSRASGIYTWNKPSVPWLFLTCGLMTGSGVLLIANYFLGNAMWISLPLIAIIITVLNLVVWIVYLKTPDQVFQNGIAPLRQTNRSILTIGVGHVLPVALLIISLVIPLPLVIPFAGLTLIFGGVFQKFTLTLEASTMRSVIQK